ncbi:mitochondrial import receptor subunit TOM40 homolog [Antedon mediterranea]|uniref:mitochondrial import receptor subunit TOM40 homolog n=1 Tax=Antedon mediterranea TaxID=105859 RepID=UPI003AF73810
MGNVNAAESPIPPLHTPLSGTAPAPPPTASVPSSLLEELRGNGDLPNPGNFEELFRRCKEIFPAPLEGCKLMVNKGLSNHFQVNHTVSLSSLADSSYHFGSTYVGTNQTGPGEAFPVLLGDIDTSGSLNAQIIHKLMEGLKTKFVLQTQQTRWMVYQLENEYRGPSYTASVVLANVNPLESTGIIVTQYLQSITKRLALGAELLYHYGQGQQQTILTLAGRYTADNWLASGTVGPASCHVAYYHKGKEVQVGVEFESNFKMQENVTSIGYQVDLPQANVTFKGMVDSNWSVSGVLEKKLLPMPFTFVISGMINHWKNKSRFGFGLMIG